MTQSLEDYIEAIYILSRETGYTRVKGIAEKLHVSRPSVIQALKHLSENGFITQERYGYIHLTETGKQTATQVLKRHQTLTQFLITLGVSPEVAEKDACRIEHVVSQETMNTIEKFLHSQTKPKKRK
ncbi:metal-dependent transcriptional regulator [Thermospira aquatica]|uniref:Transcriptional regulator MntR n=1 Tax=Thermospira aquatica TaxID=2828656 RepID=A0AAX3BEU3_9SPIR|nr:metal-dependent transcriptional regulator [Thermospira aquatica]URA10873.1 metal-dependent transcriptional regulator [Thermospira aquatica]